MHTIDNYHPQQRGRTRGMTYEAGYRVALLEECARGLCPMRSEVGVSTIPQPLLPDLFRRPLPQMTPRREGSSERVFVYNLMRRVPSIYERALGDFWT